MKILPQSVSRLIDELSKLPSIGPKTAARLAFYLLSQPDEETHNLGKAIYHLKRNLKHCSECFNISETDPCSICSDPKRKKDVILVVESPLDILAIEKTKQFHGQYHVLGGAISPVDEIGPEDLKIAQLLDRIKRNSDNISEIILGTSPDLEGESTAMFIKEQINNLKPALGKDLKITRIARGLPVGSDLEYADEITLSRALEGRREY